MSIRNNFDRVSPKDLNQDAPVASEQTTENTSQPDPQVKPMSFAAPTEFVELPSKGKYYFEGHPLHGIESVEIKYMTAKEEDILTSKTLLKKNLTLDRLLQSILVDKSINPQDLLVGDKNAIIIASRITGYGADYNTTVKCPSCGEPNKFSINLEDALADGIKDTTVDEEDATETGHGTYIVETPRTKAKVEIKFLNGHDEKRIQRAEDQRKRHKMPETLATTSMAAFIVSVNDIQDPQYIASFIENAPAADARYVRQAFQTLSPGVNMSFDFNCGACDHAQAMEVPLTAEFFWPQR